MDNEKPWEKNGEEFDAEKAWTLIQNLRVESRDKSTKLEERDAQIQALAAERDTLATTVDEQKATLQEANDDIAAREARYQELETLRTKENLLTANGLPRDFASYVPDGDEEVMTAAVEKLASLRGEGGVSTRPDPAQVAEPAEDPREALAHQLFG